MCGCWQKSSIFEQLHVDKFSILTYKVAVSVSDAPKRPKHSVMTVEVAKKHCKKLGLSLKHPNLISKTIDWHESTAVNAHKA